MKKVMLNELIEDIHRNAVDHGWWDEERSAIECIALIHSEWSEALEEDRAGRPYLWYTCSHAGWSDVCSDRSKCVVTDRECCPDRGKKPEGIAVELVDGVIRIFDLMGKTSCGLPIFTADATIDIFKGDSKIKDEITKLSFPEVIALLHRHTALIIGNGFKEAFTCVAIVVTMLDEWGMDAEKLITEKHEYNRGRPYKHGKAY